MVHIPFAALSLILGFLASTVSGTATTWKVVVPYREALGSQANVLNAALDALPASGGIAEQAQTVASVLASTTKAYQAATRVYSENIVVLGPPTNKDATDGCPEKENIALNQALDTLAAKQPAFAATGSADLIKTEITELKTSIDAFNAVWLKIAPPAYQHLPVAGKAATEASFKKLAAVFN